MTASSRPLVASPSTSTTEAPCLAPKQVDDILAEFFMRVQVDPDHLPSLAAGTPLGLPPLGPTKQSHQSSVAPTTSSARHSGRQQHLHQNRQCQQLQGCLSVRRPCTPPHRPLKKKTVKRSTISNGISSTSSRMSSPALLRRFPSSSSQHQHQHQQTPIRRRLFLVEDDKENASPSSLSSSSQSQ
ncbi:Hypothetical protein NocV09_11300060 [Nannochloropsis oceanica]